MVVFLGVFLLCGNGWLGCFGCRGREGGDEIRYNGLLGRGKFVILDKIDGDFFGKERVIVVFE